MIKIRLSRKGATNSAFYRIVAVDESKKRDGKVLEVLGFWHPAKDVKNVDKAKINVWVSKGAKKSPAVESLLK
jgi:small subunit ribosomal protein S16